MNNEYKMEKQLKQGEEIL